MLQIFCLSLPDHRISARPQNENERSQNYQVKKLAPLSSAFRENGSPSMSQ